jgi:hypothetical protein
MFRVARLLTADKFVYYSAGPYMEAAMLKRGNARVLADPNNGLQIPPFRLWRRQIEGCSEDYVLL